MPAKIKIEKNSSTRCNGKKWPLRNVLILGIAVAVAVSQVWIFTRYLDLPSDADGGANGRERHVMQQKQRLGLTDFLISMGSSKIENNSTAQVNFGRSSPRAKNPLANFLVHNSRDRVAGSHTSKEGAKKPDGVFNGYPIYRKHTSSADKPIYSQLHCIGETWHPPAFWKRKRSFLDVSWQHRSCHFQVFCYDVEEQEFVIYLDQQGDKQAASTASSHLGNYSSFWDVSQTYYRNMTQVMDHTVQMSRAHIHVAEVHHPYGVSIGSINGKWSQDGIPRLQWFPEVRYGPLPTQQSDDNDSPYEVYTLPSSVVMVPFHSLSASNPGHLVWDDFLPLYTILQIFGFTDDGVTDSGRTLSDDAAYNLLMLRFVLPPEPNSTDDRGLWAGCDWLPSRAELCQKMLHKFAPLMIREESAWQSTTQRDPDLEFFETAKATNANKEKKKLICSKNGLAGIGGLSDHGTDKGHGWEERDYTMTYNLGRGGQLWRFRNFMMRNIGIAHPERRVNADEPLLVLFSKNSSEKAHRSKSFTLEKHGLERGLQERSGELGLPPVSVEAYQFSLYTVREQIDMVSKAAVFVTSCGGGAVTATFLPRGASLLLFYSEHGGVENNNWSNKPARLDWDYFNNLGYLRVNWVPQPSPMRNVEHITDLILHELQVFHQSRL